jgi:hypothetical protein
MIYHCDLFADKDHMSYLSIIQILLFLSLFWIPQTQANSVCFIGGWPSTVRNGVCQPPWNANFENNIGIRYDQNHFCGSSNLFRCNPILHGPGDGSVPEESNGQGLASGACVPYNGDFALADQLCMERGEQNRIALQQSYENNPVFRERYDNLSNIVASNCQGNANLDLCSSLISDIRVMYQTLCNQGLDQALNAGGPRLDDLSDLALRIAQDLEERENRAPDSRAAGSCSTTMDLRGDCSAEAGNCDASDNNLNRFRNDASTRAEERQRFESTGGCPESYSCTGRPVSGGCSEGMALVCSAEYEIKVCVDTNLRVDETGTPQGFQTYNSCEQYCQSQGKRIITNNEFLVAGMGTQSQHCLSRTDRYPNNPMPDRDRNMNNPNFQTTNREVLARVDRSSCVSAYGINDMVGVLGQWVDGGETTYQFNGGLWAHHGSTLFYRTTRHPSATYQDYSIGCRCAADPLPNDSIDTASLTPVAAAVPPAVDGAGATADAAPVAAQQLTGEALALQQAGASPARDTASSGASPFAPATSPSPVARPADFTPPPEAAPAQGERGASADRAPTREPSPPIDPVEGVRDRCQIEGTDEQWRRNCENLYNAGIPPEALDYTLEIMQLNSTSFAMDQCYDSEELRESAHPSMNGHNAESIRNDLMSDGFRNKCQFVINDTDDLIPGHSCRGRMYYIDLCQGDEPQVTRDYFNIGTGTCVNGRGFTDGRNIGTTVLGAFFTNDNTFDFHPGGSRSIQPYRDLRAQIESMGGPREATAVGLIGMQNTNNLASLTGKHMHVSPYQSSLGCPSIAPENYYMIQALANNGPSLVVNFAREGMEDPQECIAE